ncbi:hypothetical protein [Streptomyces sp. CB02115]|uniref:hypothetical protein n=1 Tax=Streptomyces sp. CB02115 TaxID=1703939 RepID=UPI001A7E1116|nr:hypothetical protein [Streptomyces sp. CB02115]
MVVAPEVRQLGLQHARVWVLSGETPLTEPVLSAAQAARLLASLPSEDSVAGYRRLMSALGHPDTVPAGERLRELVASRPWQGHGGVIDAVTIASVVAGGGIGLHDVNDMDSEAHLVVRRSPGGERITPAFSSRSRPIPEGDLTYGALTSDGCFQPFAWLGKRDTDAATLQVSPSSRQVCVVALGHPGDTAEHTERVISSVTSCLDVLGIQVRVTPLPRVPVSLPTTEVTL